jgi:acyl-coenzyme A synthetase/AMP-(fatty) acid ligase
LRELAREGGDAVAAIDGICSPSGPEALPQVMLERAVPARLTYAELHQGADRLAAALAQRLSLSAREHDREEVFTIATWMRRGNAWYLVFHAAARLLVPIVALSLDIPDKAVETRRNGEILSMHRPRLVVVDHGDDVSSASTAISVVQFASLWAEAWSPGLPPAPEVAASVNATLCFCYTGGTTKASRCARITHGMALHELAMYRSVVSLGREDRVLQQHSAYWAASAYGEFDIALAFGCALVFAEATDADAMVQPSAHTL